MYLMDRLMNWGAVMEGGDEMCYVDQCECYWIRLSWRTEQPCLTHSWFDSTMVARNHAFQGLDYSGCPQDRLQSSDCATACSQSADRGLVQFRSKEDHREENPQRKERGQLGLATEEDRYCVYHSGR